MLASGASADDVCDIISHSAFEVNAQIFTGVTSFKLASEGSLAMTIDAAGAVTKPLQPAFEVKPASAQNNIAVASNVVVVFGTELMDIGGNFASNTFTAPVAGVYQFNIVIATENLDSVSNYYETRLRTTNELIDMTMDPDFGQDAAYWTFTSSITVPLDASDTADVLFVQAGGTQQTDIRVTSRFSGYLVA